MSERNLHGDFVTASQAEVVRPALLCEMQFPSGTVNIWTGQFPIAWNSKTWTGTGELVGFSSFPEKTDGSAQGMQIIVSGIDSSLISDATDDEFQGSPVAVWIALLDSYGLVVNNPFKMFGGLMDTAEIKDDGNKATITINAESRLIDQLRPIQWRYTNQDQQRLYPGDLGLQYIAGIQDKQFVWRS